MAAVQNFSFNPEHQSAPPRSWKTVTPADVDLTYVTRGIWVGGSGNVRVTTAEGDDVVFVGAVAGTIIPVQAKRIWTTNTTATSLLAGY